MGQHMATNEPRFGCNTLVAHLVVHFDILDQSRRKPQTELQNAPLFLDAAVRFHMARHHRTQCRPNSADRRNATHQLGSNEPGGLHQRQVPAQPSHKLVESARRAKDLSQGPYGV